MQRIIHMLRGKVCLEIEGAFPERFLNLLAQHGVPFWGLQWRSPLCLRLYVARVDAKRTAALAERAMCACRVLGQKGLPFLLLRLRRLSGKTEAGDSPTLESPPERPASG